MEDLGDYIYIIAIVIAGLSSLFKKKRKPEEQSTGGMPDLDDVLPDLEEDYLPRPEPTSVGQPVRIPEPYVREMVQPAVNTQQQSGPLSYETVSDYMKLRAKKTVKPAAKPVSDAMKTEEEVSDDFQLELDTAEDAKKAFVYAEIFNRKY